MNRQNLDIRTFLSEEEERNLNSFIKNKETPYLVVSLDRIKKNYTELHNALPFAKIYYAVKANPDEKILELLKNLGSCFDIASKYELDQLLKLGVDASRISYGNTIKKSPHIKYAFEKGIRMFASDSENDVMNIAKNAPGSKVYFRLMWDCVGSDWPLSRKFGTHGRKILSLIELAKKLGLKPCGISFHVGSQQKYVGEWSDAINQSKYLFGEAKKKFNIDLSLLNLGGGLPVQYISPIEKTEHYTSNIVKYLTNDFGSNMPEIIIEPGRSLVADAGIIVTEVINASQKTQSKHDRWLFVDIGKFNGLIETIDENIKFPIFEQVKHKQKKIPMILAGPTCDSMDTLYEKFKYQFSADIAEGDKLFVLVTGAYTQSYSSINFNGFPSLKAYITKDFKKEL